jgi:hypothetical protein
MSAVITQRKKIGSCNLAGIRTCDLMVDGVASWPLGLDPVAEDTKTRINVN